MRSNGYAHWAVISRSSNDVAIGSNSSITTKVIITTHYLLGQLGYVVPSLRLKPVLLKSFLSGCGLLPQPGSTRCKCAGILTTSSHASRSDAIHLEPVEMLKCRYMTGIYTCHMTTYDVYPIYTRHIPVI